MPRAKRLIQSAVTIDGIPLVWHLAREQQWCTADGWKGVAIHVKVVEGVRRDLHLEYPTARTEKLNYLRTDSIRQNISPTKVAAHIREAIAAGWDPGSRGKAFVYEVEELPG